MIARVLVDTGPLVAIISRRDNHHDSCVEQLRHLSPPLLSCWPVMTEAGWLLRNDPSAVQQLFNSVDTGLVRLLELNEGAVPWIAEFLRRYQKLGAQVADACLVYLAEREGIDTVFTLDRRDFSVYRLSGNRKFQIVPGF